MGDTIASQFNPNRCKNFRNRSESLMVLRLVRLALKSALPAGFATWKSQRIDERFVRDPEGESGPRA